MADFHTGQKVSVALTTPNPFGGPAITTYEPSIVLSNESGQVWLDNGEGNDPSGPFDAKTGRRIESLVGCSMRLVEYEPSHEEEE